MRRYDYVPKVLGCLTRLTPQERMAVRQELYAHIEDHMDALMELGYDYKLAEQRTMERMGDPEEIGRALNAQYPPGWLTLKRVAKGAAVVLALILLIQVSWSAVRWNIGCRIAPNWVLSDVYKTERYAFLKDHPSDMRFQVGSTMVRVCAVGVVPVEQCMDRANFPEDAEYIAGVVFCAYPASWRDLGQRVDMPAYDGLDCFAGYISGSFATYLIAVEPGEQMLTAFYTLYGHDVSVDIPLDWEGVP